MDRLIPVSTHLCFTFTVLGIIRLRNASTKMAAKPNGSSSKILYFLQDMIHKPNVTVFGLRNGYYPEGTTEGKTIVYVVFNGNIYGSAGKSKKGGGEGGDVILPATTPFYGRLVDKYLKTT
jgi:hypothetical protein